MAVWVASIVWATGAWAAPVVFDFEAEGSGEAWTLAGPEAARKVTRDPEEVRQGTGALLCTYTGQAGAPFSLTQGELDLAGVQSVSFSAKASQPSPLVLILAEEDGSLYHTFVTLPAGEWCEVALPLADLQLQDGSTDENAALDAEQVRTLTFQELANMPGEWGEIFSAKLGAQTLSLDDVSFTADEQPSRSRADNGKVLVDDFARPWFALLPLGGARLSHIPGNGGDTPSALRIGFTFMPDGPRAWPGVVLPVGHVDLTGARTLRLRVKAQGPANLHVLLEEQDGSRYELQSVIPEADDWQARDLALADFTLEAGGTDENGALDLDQLRVIIVVMDAWSALLDEQEAGSFSLDDVLFLEN